MRNNDVRPGDLAPLDKFKNLGTIPVSHRTPEQRMKDLQDTTNWMRQKGRDDEASDPTMDFRKLDAALPIKKGQSLDDRARMIEMALDWVRTSGPSPVVDNFLVPTTVVGLVPAAVRSPEERKKDLLLALNWIRNGKHSSDDLTRNFKKIDQLLPAKLGQSPEDRARDLEGCLDWMRNNGVAPAALADIESFSKVGFLPASRRTPEQRAQDLDSALNWLRNKGADDDALDPTGDFRRLDSAMPRKSGENDEDRARQIESALDWLREKSMNPAFEEGVPSFKKSSGIPLCSRTPNERIRDVKDVLQWIRNGRKPSDDATGNFRKVDQVLPRRIGQSPETRARDIEAAL
jgi:hypothetical protein